MRLKALTLKDFRSIRHIEIKFDEQMTVIVGRNGSGKSSILNAVAAMLMPVQRMWPDKRQTQKLVPVHLSQTDTRWGAESCAVSVELELYDGRHGVMHVGLAAGNSSRDKSRPDPTYNQLWNNILSDTVAVGELVLAVYYKQDRGFDDNSRSSDPLNFSELVLGSLGGQLKAIANLESWWDKRDAQEARRVRDEDPEYRDPQLQLIRTIITEIDDFEGISYDAIGLPPGLYLSKRGGSRIHIDQLSSGERSFIILLADLSRRLQMMRPDRDLSSIPGIVLIDEIELNLHPAWQSKILSTLLRVFPKCQFVVTTHSPQVVSSIENECVRILAFLPDGSTRVEVPLSTKGRTSNYLLEGVFGAPERSPEIDKLFNDFDTAIDNSKLKIAKELLEKIRSSVDGDPPELLVLKNRLRRASTENEG